MDYRYCISLALIWPQNRAHAMASLNQCLIDAGIYAEVRMDNFKGVLPILDISTDADLTRFFFDHGIIIDEDAN